MWISIGKLEFKKGFIYYLVIYLFFFFWSLISLFALFIFINFSHLEKIVIKKSNLSILFYPENPEEIKNIKEAFNKLNYIKEIKLYNPEDLYRTYNKELPSDLFENENPILYFPYLIEIKLRSNDFLSQFKKDLQIIKDLTHFKLELLSDPLSKDIPFLKYAKFLFFIFIILWFLLYFLLFIFSIKSLSNHLLPYFETFQLLGGHVLKLKIIRSLFLLIPLLFLSFFSFFLYYLIMNKMIYFFPILKSFPEFKNNFDLLFLLNFYFFIIFVIPLFLVFVFTKKV